MTTRHLQTRFILAGCLLVLTTVISALWSALTFAQLSATVSAAVRQGQRKIDLSARLAGSLEREDDALLLVLGGNGARARRNLAAERRRSDDYYEELRAEVGEGDSAEAAAVRALRGEIQRYRAAGSELVALRGPKDGLERYHRQVNPLLRQAVGTCATIREENFKAMQQAGVRARDVAGQATWVVAGVLVCAVVLATVVSVWLARSVIVPVRELTASVEAVRQGDFERRVTPAGSDELGQLANGFNRMAETLGEYRRSSLGELLSAKITLEETLNALPDAVLVIAPDGTLAASNPPALKLLAALGAAKATTLAEVPLPAEHSAAVRAALSGRPSMPTRTDFRAAIPAEVDGRPRRFLLAALPIPEFAPRQFGAVLVLEDVTDFARLDELRSELIGVASHELKNPLTTLRLSLQMLQEGVREMSVPQREMVETALLGCVELGATIDELLDVTRIEAGQLRLNRAPMDLRAAIDVAVAGLRSRFESAGVGVQVVEEGRPPSGGGSAGSPQGASTLGPARLQGDAARLGLVLTNLLANALKYSPPGGSMQVRLSDRKDGNGKPTWQVAVTDQGPGIPAEFRERVFEKFFRVEHHLGEQSGRPHGTGLGLYLCREIIEAHGGTIWTEPGDAGRGTRVTFTLPRNGEP
jgi:NtrC-family two-component system sensor histidine kinase KinB